jgi:hypothetical protein
MARRAWLAAVVLGVAAGCRPVDDDPLTHGSLVELEELDEGDADCPAGGVRVFTGVDDGAGDGVPDDGALQPGEVDASRAICDPAPDTDAPVPPRWLSLDAPGGPVGDAVIDVHGGEGERAGGGSGGLLTLSMPDASARGHLAVFATGAPSAPPPLPPEPRIDLGPTPYEVTEDVTFVESPWGAEHAPGEVFLREDSTLLMLEDGRGGTPITGLHVHPGVTLTLPPSAGGRTLLFHDGVYLEGTLAVAGGDDLSLDLTCAAFHATDDAVIDLSAPSGSADEAGLAGGDLHVTVGTTGPEVPRNAGSLWMQGTIDTRGASGASGGDAGAVTLRSPTDLVAGGTFLGAGGAALGEAVGGDGAPVRLEANHGLAWVHARFELSGGGGGAAGGLGGSVVVGAARVDDRSTYELDGGDGGATCAGRCAGGAGGALLLSSSAGSIVHEGPVHARGGRGTGADERGGSGGRGGLVVVQADTLTGATLAPEQRIELAGELVLSGGDGTGTGGRGGAVEVDLTSPYDRDATVRLYGFARVDAHGGATSAQATGGDGGTIGLSLKGGDAGGGLVIAPDLDLRGGSGRKGGAGGFLSLDSVVSPGDLDPARAVRVDGDVLLDGGDGTTSGGTSGTLHVAGVHDVALTGDVTAIAGASPGGSGVSALRSWLDEPGVHVEAWHGDVTLAGALRVRGGDGRDTGGRAGFLLVTGVHVRAVGPIEAVGGTSSAGRGGDGGFLQLTSALPPTTVEGTIDVAAGDGATTPGTPGQVWIDGVGGHPDDP